MSNPALEAAWGAFVEEARKAWPESSEGFLRIQPHAKAIAEEIYPKIYIDDDQIDMENGITPDMWKIKAP